MFAVPALPDASDFDLRRQVSELEAVTSSQADATYLAEAYIGWPLTRARPADAG